MSTSSADYPHRITITICGDGGCGKSSITLRLVRSQWTHEYDPTIEDSYTLTRKVDGQTYHLSLTDTAGQEEYRGMWASSNLRSDAFLLVYDITNMNSLGVLQEFNDLIDIEAETRMDAWERDRYQSSSSRKKKGAGALDMSAGPVKPIKIVAGNKCDLQESRQVPAQVGLEWARKHGCGFMETSARNTVNIEETFALIIRRVVEARRLAQDGGAGGRLTVDVGATRREESLGSNAALGTRRAVTAPLSPLPGGPEKVLSLEGEEGGGGRWRAFWRKLACWKR
ncbi:P-loop containing nucleoside triphosphate hydrolase protein [Leptodontidium sp. 2 PMI_412]|nr:ras family protein [Leptodontidium sp. MPI-SDFR-AT-0119]KAH9213655.1 P-loop containing nucleoside triphosphate hydrolase protein [Leptodontidium sp. 2 PMI_412]